MKISKAEYNENATDVDALEKARLHEEGETERHLTLQQELTKRQLSSDQEKTRQQLSTDKEQTNQGDNHLYGIIWVAAACVAAAIAFSIAGYCSWEDYVSLEKAKISTPACPKCHEVMCQPVPAK